MTTRTFTTRLLLLTALALLAIPAAGVEIAVEISDNEVTLQPEGRTLGVSYGSAEILVTGPADFTVRQDDLTIRLQQADGLPLADGEYVWQVRLTPMLTAGERDTLSRIKLDRAVALHLAKRIAVESGVFRVVDGQIVEVEAEPAQDENWERAIDRLIEGDAGEPAQISEMSTRIEVLEDFLADLSR